MCFYKFRVGNNVNRTGLGSWASQVRNGMKRLCNDKDLNNGWVGFRLRHSRSREMAIDFRFMYRSVCSFGYYIFVLTSYLCTPLVEKKAVVKWCQPRLK